MLLASIFKRFLLGSKIQSNLDTFTISILSQNGQKWNYFQKKNILYIKNIFVVSSTMKIKEVFPAHNWEKNVFFSLNPNSPS